MRVDHFLLVVVTDASRRVLIINGNVKERGPVFHNVTNYKYYMANIIGISEDLRKRKH